MFKLSKSLLHFKKKIISLMLILFTVFLIYGCSEIVNVAGITLNALTASNGKEIQILIQVTNSENQLVRYFNISIKENYNNKCLSTCKFTNNTSPISFNLPDEQINSIPPGTTQISISAEYPGYGKFEKQIDINEFNIKQIVFIDFNVGQIPDNIEKAPLLKYSECR